MLWRKAERCCEYSARSRLISNSPVFFLVFLAICDTVLAACTAGSATSASVNGAALATNHGNSFGIAQQGELYLVLMPPDVLIGDLAEARR